MTITTRHESCLIWLAVLATCWFFPIASSSSDNVRIYLLTGQSNMVGEGCEAHLDYLVTNNSAMYGHLKNANGDWTQHANVNVVVYPEEGALNLETQLQPLTSVGHGEEVDKFGPEVGIGWTLAEKYPNTKILLIKVAWGGIDLAINLRPPSSSTKWNGDDSISIADKYGSSDAGLAGQYYQNLISRTNAVLTALPTETYGSSPELDGIFFLQGWNDLADQSGNRMQEYEYNLVNFITDIRSDLNAIDVPFVFGESGQHGDSHDGMGHEVRVDGVRQAQQNVAKRYPQFFCNAQLAGIAKIVIALQDQNKQCPTPTSCKCPEFHYYNNAEIFYKIGLEMGNIMTSFADCIMPGPSAEPTASPSSPPTIIPPTESPMPSPAPSETPTETTSSPTFSPSSSPSMTSSPSHNTPSPTSSPKPSPAPTEESPPPTDTQAPSPNPTHITDSPTFSPTTTIKPSASPSETPISAQLKTAIVTLEGYLEEEFAPSDDENKVLWDAVEQMHRVAQLQQSNE